MKTIRFVAAVASMLMACPTNPLSPDAGNDSGVMGNPAPIDACSGGCSDNQVCDADGGLGGTPRTCVSGCLGGCDAGACRRVPGTGAFECELPTTACSGTTCAAGQKACVSNECSCLASARGTQDTCQAEGQWCRGRTCETPRRYEQCLVGGSRCPTGEVCRPVFSVGTPNEIALCLKDCAAGANQCDVGEVCARNPGLMACLPSGLFNGQECSQNVVVDAGVDDAGVPKPTDGGFETFSDGGLRLTVVPVGNTCLTKNDMGVITDNPGKGRGNCTYAGFKAWRFGFFPFETCLPPGTAQLNDRCVRDFSAATSATRCGTGLECAYTGGPTRVGVPEEGVCLKVCNANPSRSGFVSQPACGLGEACVNLYRYTDPSDNSVLGVCMKTCNVFSATNSTCAPIGAQAASCVPASADGQLPLTLNGDGICVPQQRTIAALGARCSEPDPFRGATCGAAQVCASNSLTEATSCTRVCDTSCAPADGGTPPARCATQPNALCPQGRSCRRASTTTGATVGYCQ